jgi:signal transduction histidine kinase
MLKRGRPNWSGSFLHSQKLEALGTLAGGIAHDLNNTLVPVMALTKLIAKRMPPGNRGYDNLQIVVGASERARDLVQQILLFSRKQTVEKKVVDLSALTGQALQMLRARVPTSIGIVQRFTAGALVHADPGQLHQVIVNLVTNTAQAIGERPGQIAVEVSGFRRAVTGARTAPLACRSQIPVAAWTRRPPRASSSRSSPPRRLAPAPGLDFPSSTAS